MYANGEKGTVVRLRPATYKQLGNLSKQTRQSMSELAQLLIEYALRHSTVKPVQLYDIVFEEDGE